jgi:hypothetical protein
MQQPRAATRDTDKLAADPLELSIVAQGVAQLTFAQIDEVRKKPPAVFTPRLSAQFLKHSDEQTLASLVALDRAMTDAALPGSDFDKWSIISASRNFGRAAMAAAIDKYRDDGPWGVSVQVIPHRTPHAVCGTISLALLNHGPCVGVGGRVGQEVSALLATAGLLRHDGRDGVWVLLSAWLPELMIEINGKPTSESACVAIALGVVGSESVASESACLGRIRFDASQDAVARQAEIEKQSGLAEGLTEFLAGDAGSQRVWSIITGETLRVEVDLTPASRKPAGGRMLRSDRAHPLPIPPGAAVQPLAATLSSRPSGNPQ